jgi:uracil-DNA glycosylase
MFSLAEIDTSWHSIFEPHLSEINSILISTSQAKIAPARELIFRSFALAFTDVKVVILGQDPYPGEGVADGLAFSSGLPGFVPASLRNIFKEYCDDLGFHEPSSSTLHPWLSEGVLLLNTALTTEVGQRDKHKSVGWENLISSILSELAKRDVVAILWGNSAISLGGGFAHRIESVHPSPLSSYRGFFGSKPFSKANTMLVHLGYEPVNWKLS